MFNPRNIGRSVANSLRNEAQASVQNFVGNNLNTGIGFIDRAVNNAVGDIFSPLGFGKTQRSGNLPSSTQGKVKTPTLARFSTSTTDSDWRVKISVPQKFMTQEARLMAPLSKTNGNMIFPYTPTIILSHTANYNSLNPVHTNYPFQIYENSQADDITITGEFIVENAEEGQYWIACIHFLRSITKMFYGTDGSPPMTVRLSGYGDYVFNNVPCVISNFTVDLPSDVDYIACPLSIEIGREADGPPGSGLGPQDTETLISTASGTSWAPTQSQISVTLKPTYSRRRISEFNLNDFVNGKYINGGQGFI